MRHLRELLTTIADITVAIILWLMARFGEFTTYLGMLIIGLCLVLFFPADLIKGMLIFGMLFVGVVFINYKGKHRG